MWHSNLQCVALALEVCYTVIIYQCLHFFSHLDAVLFAHVLKEQANEPPDFCPPLPRDLDLAVHIHNKNGNEGF